MRVGIFVEHTGETEPGEMDFSVEATVKEEVLLEELRRRYDLLQEETDTVNTKAGVALAFLGGMLLSFIDDFSKLPSEIDVPSWVFLILFLVLGVLYASATVCMILAIKPYQYIAPIGVEESELEAYVGMDRSKMLLQLLVQYGSGIEKSQPEFRKKNHRFFVGLICTFVFIMSLLITGFALVFL